MFTFEQVLCDIITRNPYFVLITDNFNARAEKLWKNDTVTTEGTKIDSITTSYGFNHIISDPTHILPHSPLCIDFIFTHQPNLVIESEFHPSLHSNCHYEISFAKLILKTGYPPLYERLSGTIKILMLKSVVLINPAIENFNWEK